jgi:arylsulfatase A-like enzyme
MNTLLVTVDALRADHVGYHGYDRPTTPALDTFAAEHTCFTSAFANGTFTSAALPAILTGSLRKDSADPATIDKNLQVRTPNVASVLQEAGIHTVGINTNLLFDIWYERVDGFDEFHEFVPVDEEEGGEEEDREESLLKRLGKPIAEALGVKPKARKLYDRFRSADELRSTTYYDAAEVTDRALEWLDNQGSEEFFLWVHYMDPHEPYDYLDSMSTEPIPADSEAHDAAPGRIAEGAKRAGQDPERITAAERDLLVDLYDGYVRYFDDHLGRLLDAMHDSGLYDDTQVFVTADHGEEFGEHGEFFHYNKPYDELIHVPLVVKSPVVDPGIRDEQVRHVDIAPTIAAGHGLDTGRFQGDTLGEDHGDRPVVALGSDRPYFDISSRPFAAYREPEWKLVHHHEEPDELYHLEADPDERRDVLDDHPDVADRLSTELRPHLEISDAERTTTDEEALDDEEEAVKRRLDDLGYLQ